MSNPISVVTARAFFDHILKESYDKRLSTYEEFETSCDKYPTYKINDVDESGNTALHIAATCGNVFLINTIFQKAKELLDWPNKLGETPLCKAVQKWKFEAAEALLEYGASVSVTFTLLNTTRQMSLLALAVDESRKAVIHLNPQKIVGLLLQYNISYEDRDTLAKQVFLNNLNLDYLSISKHCSRIIQVAEELLARKKIAEELLARKKKTFVKVLSKFIAVIPACLVVQYINIK